MLTLNLIKTLILLLVVLGFSLLILFTFSEKYREELKNMMECLVNRIKNIFELKETSC